MTPVSSEICETCSNSRGILDIEAGRQRFYCEKDLQGIQPCKSYSREPGSDDDAPRNPSRMPTGKRHRID